MVQSIISNIEHTNTLQPENCEFQDAGGYVSFSSTESSISEESAKRKHLLSSTCELISNVCHRESEHSSSKHISADTLVHQIVVEYNSLQYFPSLNCILSVIQGFWDKKSNQIEQDNKTLHQPFFDDTHLQFVKKFKQFDSETFVSLPPGIIVVCLVLLHLEMLFGPIHSNLRNSLRSSYWFIHRLTLEVKYNLFSQWTQDDSDFFNCDSCMNASLLHCESHNEMFDKLVHNICQDGFSLMKQKLNLDYLKTIYQDRSTLLLKLVNLFDCLSKIFIGLYGNYLTQRITVIANDQSIIGPNWNILEKDVLVWDRSYADIVRRQYRTINPLLLCLDLCLTLVETFTVILSLIPTVENYHICTLQQWLSVTYTLKIEFTFIFATALRLTIRGVAGIAFAMNEYAVTSSPSSSPQCKVLYHEMEILTHQWFSFFKPIISITERIKLLKDRCPVSDDANTNLSLSSTESIVCEIYKHIKALLLPPTNMMQCFDDLGKTNFTDMIRNFSEQYPSESSLIQSMCDTLFLVMPSQTTLHCLLNEKDGLSYGFNQTNISQEDNYKNLNKIELIIAPTTDASTSFLPYSSDQELSEDVPSPNSSMVAAFDSDFSSFCARTRNHRHLENDSLKIGKRHSNRKIQHLLSGHDLKDNQIYKLKLSNKQQINEGTCINQANKSQCFQNSINNHHKNTSEIVSSYGTSKNVSVFPDLSNDLVSEDKPPIKSLYINNYTVEHGKHFKKPGSNKRLPESISTEKLDMLNFEHDFEEAVLAPVPSNDNEAWSRNNDSIISPHHRCYHPSSQRILKQGLVRIDHHDQSSYLFQQFNPKNNHYFPLYDPSPDLRQVPKNQFQSPSSRSISPILLRKQGVHSRDPLPQVGRIHQESDHTEKPRQYIQRDHNICPRYEWEVDHSEVRLEEKIGSGATSKVYRGWWRGTEVAVKKMLPGIGNSVNEDEKFQREIQILLKLRHPNLTLLMGAGVRYRPFFLIMEYCQGGDLFTLLHLPEKSSHTFTRLTIQQKIKIAIDIAKGMTYLHQSLPQVIHRDLKSLNILLTTNIKGEYDEPHAKITDFGLSQLRIGNTHELLYQTAAVGTFHWMAPEILMSQPYNEKVDVYSYGILLFEIFSQTIPYSSPPVSSKRQSYGPRENVIPFTVNPPVYSPGIANSIDIVLAVSRGYRPNLSCLSRNCPKMIVSLIEACWAEGPTERPSFDVVLRTLKQLARTFH